MATDAPACVSRPGVAIIGGGIAGLAAALALQRRGVPCRVYERDPSFEGRKQGYGLTMQAATTLEELGVLEEVRAADTPSCEHWTFTPAGHVRGYFGSAFVPGGPPAGALRFNIRIPREDLRRILLQRLAPGTVVWGVRMLGMVERADGVTLRITRGVGGPGGAEAQAEAETVVDAAVVVGADGIHSSVRRHMGGGDLSYLGVVLLLGVSSAQHYLLDRRGFYTIDGRRRLFTMPFDVVEGGGRARQGGPPLTMWQLSFALEDEAEARALAAQGPAGLLARAQAETADWHDPVASLLAGSAMEGPHQVWGTPLFDFGEEAPGIPGRSRRRSGAPRQRGRGLRLQQQQQQQQQQQHRAAQKEAAQALAGRAGGLEDGAGATGEAGVLGEAGAAGGCASAPFGSPTRPVAPRITLIGDAAHPMSPFKGQGANQALRDGPALASWLAKVPGLAPQEDGSSEVAEEAEEEEEKEEADKEEEKKREEAEEVQGAAPANEGGRAALAGPAAGVRRKVARTNVHSALLAFEREMMLRAGAKVLGSREAAAFFHSDAVLREPQRIAGVNDTCVAEVLAIAAERGVTAACGANIVPRFRSAIEEMNARVRALAELSNVPPLAADDGASVAASAEGSPRARATLLYYCYLDLRTRREEVAAWYEEAASSRGVVGRVRVARDGVNATLGGERGALEAHVADMRAHPIFKLHVIDFKMALSDGPRSSAALAGCCFTAFTAKLCDEIVTMQQTAATMGRKAGGEEEEEEEEDGDGGAISAVYRGHPSHAGVHLSPEAFHASLLGGGGSAPRADVIIDVRNAYEHDIGRFSVPEGSGVKVLLPLARTFADFPGWFDAHEEELRGKNVLMYCTGGVRCERASAYLREKGPEFTSVYQLRGGIQRYMEAGQAGKLPGASLYKGKMFVFDERPAVPVGGGEVAAAAAAAAGTVGGASAPEVLGACLVCATPWDVYSWMRCARCGVLVLACDGCVAAAGGPDAMAASGRLSCASCRAALGCAGGAGGAGGAGSGPGGPAAAGE